jgi:hypothetical protein
MIPETSSGYLGHYGDVSEVPRLYLETGQLLRSSLQSPSQAVETFFFFLIILIPAKPCQCIAGNNEKNVINSRESTVDNEV